MFGKSELAQRIAEKTGMSHSKANQVLNEVLESISEALARGEEVRLTGFGSFRVADTKERMGINPLTRERIRVPAGKRLSFSAGTQLTASVRGEAGGKAA